MVVGTAETSSAGSACDGVQRSETVAVIANVGDNAGSGAKSGNHEDEHESHLYEVLVAALARLLKSEHRKGLG